MGPIEFIFISDLRIRNLAGKARNAAQELAEYDGNEVAVSDVVVAPFLG